MEYILFFAMAAVAVVAVIRAVKTADSNSKLREENATLSTSLSHLKEDITVRERQYIDQLAEKDRHYAELSSMRDRQIAEEREIQKRHIEEERANSERLIEARLKNMADEIMHRNTAEFKAQNEQRLEEILSPLRNNLDEFRKTVTETYNSEARERFSLTERIRELVELNNTISKETRDLTHALKGNNQVQGDWGEMVLENILEQSGLQEGEEYFRQMTTDAQGSALRGENGRGLQPDVVVKYPDGRCVIIDSKVSLTAFVECTNAGTAKEQEDAASRHVKSVRAHVDELARKNYQNYIGDVKLDFVMMFIPNEPAYISAMRHEPSLWTDAYKKKVLIVSPTHLVSGLRLIEQLWSRDKVTKNAIRIAEDAGKMYDKFADFTKDMERIATALNNAKSVHEDALKKLATGNGNLVRKSQELKDLGIKASKQLAASILKLNEETAD